MAGWEGGWEGEMPNIAAYWRERSDRLERDLAEHDEEMARRGQCIVELEAKLAAAEDRERGLRADWEMYLSEPHDVFVKLREALGALADSCAYPEFDDVRLDYISVQIDRDDLARAKSALTPPGAGEDA